MCNFVVVLVFNKCLFILFVPQGQNYLHSCEGPDDMVSCTTFPGFLLSYIKRPNKLLHKPESWFGLAVSGRLVSGRTSGLPNH